MSQPDILRWKTYGTLARMAQAAVAPMPDCKFGKI